MQINKILVSLLAVLLIASPMVAAAVEHNVATDQYEAIMPGPADTVVTPLDNIRVQNSWNDGSFIKAQNLNCGLPPLPPLGCRVGPCVCDQTGTKCQWTFICG